VDVAEPTSSTSHLSADTMNTACHEDTAAMMSATVSSDSSECASTPTSNTVQFDDPTNTAVSADSPALTSNTPQSDDPMSTACHDEASSAVSHSVSVDGADGNSSAGVERPQVATYDVTCQTTEVATLARELLYQLKTSGIPDETMISIPKGLLQKLLELGKDLPGICYVT